jgi:uncharacterized protein
MEALFERFRQKLAYTDTIFVRSLMDSIAWDARLIGIRGARGVGKTTLLLQYIKLHLPSDASVLYVSLDHIWFTEHKVYDLAEHFVKMGGRYLFLDEVHKYRGWAQELKNMYDDFPELKVVFTGSSLLEILNAKADLSRRAIVYEMQGFSFREYLNRNLKTSFPIQRLEDLLNDHLGVSNRVTSEIKVLQHFNAYLKYGYYPYYNELPSLYLQRVEEVVNMVVEIELPLLRNVDPVYTPKVRQLLLVLAESVPFIPNISKLSERIGITRIGLLNYLNALHEARLTIHLEKDAFGLTRLQKPEKIFLENTNLMYSLSPESVNLGNLRETFFVNQLNYSHQVLASTQSDFLVDGKYTFEVGGKEKTARQLAGLENAFIAADDIEYGLDRKIPLWMFGFLY